MLIWEKKDITRVWKEVWYQQLVKITIIEKREIGTILGIKIGRNAFGKEIHILHPFNIIVNRDAHIYNDCTLHGSVYIGNNADTGWEMS